MLSFVLSMDYEEFTDFFLAYPRRRRLDAIRHVLRHLLVKIYDSQIPLFDGFDRYDSILDAKDHSADAVQDMEQMGYSLRKLLRNKNTEEATNILLLYHEALERRYNVDAKSLNLTFHMLSMCTAKLANDTPEAGLAIVQNMIIDYLRKKS